MVVTYLATNQENVCICRAKTVRSQMTASIRNTNPYLIDGRIVTATSLTVDFININAVTDWLMIR